MGREAGGVLRCVGEWGRATGWGRAGEKRGEEAGRERMVEHGVFFFK